MQECLRLSINWAFAKYSLDNRVRVVNSNEVRIVKVSAQLLKRMGENAAERRGGGSEDGQDTKPPQMRANTHPPTHPLQNAMIHGNFGKSMKITPFLLSHAITIKEL